MEPMTMEEFANWVIVNKTLSEMTELMFINPKMTASPVVGYVCPNRKMEFHHHLFNFDTGRWVS